MSQTLGPRGRSILFRLFALVWGLVAIGAGGLGLQQDLRFRAQGVAVTGWIAGHTLVGGRDDMGVARYRVGGATYDLVTNQTAGVWRLGAPDRIFYLPADPAHGREADEMGVDLMFVVVGAVMLILAATYDGIVRAFRRGRTVIGAADATDEPDASPY